MKHILCYGDSNTWGYDPVTQDRFDRDTRWPGALRNALGDGYEIIEEGLGGRTTVEAGEHLKLGQAVAGKVRELLG